MIDQQLMREVIALLKKFILEKPLRNTFGNLNVFCDFPVMNGECHKNSFLKIRNKI